MQIFKLELNSSKMGLIYFPINSHHKASEKNAPYFVFFSYIFKFWLCIFDHNHQKKNTEKRTFFLLSVIFHFHVRLGLSAF